MAEGRENDGRKRSVRIHGHRTSISLEEPFWQALKAAAARRGLSVSALVADIDRSRTGSLSSAIRVFLLAEAGVKANESLSGPE
ncbi:MAG: ribbon-helix-helix domain-containing protein [Alphaproteobacteria bacterium]